MACTVCYHSVLQEFLAYAGRALERLIQGLQSQEELVPDISLALFLQLCMRQEGTRVACMLSRSVEMILSRHFLDANTHSRDKLLYKRIMTMKR